MEIFLCGLFFLVLHIVIYQSALIPKKTLLPYNIPGYAHFNFKTVKFRGK